jgi:bisphosphoglycerate-dependent phosphoglycerate mutase family 1
MITHTGMRMIEGTTKNYQGKSAVYFATEFNLKMFCADRCRYGKLSELQLERSRAESLKDTADRIMPFYNSVIEPSLRSGNRCLIVSHANTIRTLIKQLDGISDEDIKGMSIPTGIPLLYRLDKNLKPVDPVNELEFRYMVEPKGCVFGLVRVPVSFHADC